MVKLWFRVLFQIILAETKARVKQFLLFIFILISFNFQAQSLVSGQIFSEFGEELPNVLVVNISTGEKSYSDVAGNFKISAIQNQEIRFVRDGYERGFKIISEPNLYNPLNIYLNKIATEIEVVDVSAFKPTGDLKKDSKSLSKPNKIAELQASIGLPKAPEKPREKPAEVKQVLLPVLLGQLNIQGAYDLISGKARRQKRAYRYDDLQDRISWVRSRLGDGYFEENGIEKEKIPEFLQFAFFKRPQILTFIKSKNISGAEFQIQAVFPEYLKQKNSK